MHTYVDLCTHRYVHIWNIYTHACLHVHLQGLLPGPAPRCSLVGTSRPEAAGCESGPQGSRAKPISSHHGVLFWGPYNSPTLWGLYHGPWFLSSVGRLRELKSSLEDANEPVYMVPCRRVDSPPPPMVCPPNPNPKP